MKTKVLLLVDDQAFIKNLTKDLEKISCAIIFPGKRGVLFSVFEDVPHVIVIDEDYKNNNGRSIATEIKDDVVLKYIPIILVVRDDKSVLAKDHQRIDAVVSKTRSTKALVKIVHETFQSSSHELDFNPLTHLPGIHTAVVKIDREIDAKNKFAVLCVDLSNLGAFNTTYGDVRGDEVIIRLSEILKKAIRLYGNTKDFLCHLGGDDFIILTTTDRAVQITEVIIQNFDAEVQSFYDHDDRERGYIVQRSAEGTLKQFPIMNVSVAIVENDTESYLAMSDVSRTAGELARSMNKLPGSCYARIRQAKIGKNPHSKQGQFEIHFPGKMKSVMSGNGVPSGIEEYTNYFYEILKEKKVKTLYQPVLDIKQRKIVGYEALTRPTIHYPSNEATTLFSVARQTNHVKDLDKLCIEFALKSAQTLLPEFKLFLNLNHETLLDRQAMFQLFSSKGSIGFKNIVIEVTEQSILRSFDKIREALTELKEQGVSVAIDDVGGGAVSLRDVALLKPDYIKFDRLLVRQVDISSTKQQILLSLTLFSKGIGSITVAEGIETREEFEAVRMCGVDMVQGYYFARPGDAFPEISNLTI